MRGRSRPRCRSPGPPGPGPPLPGCFSSWAANQTLPAPCIRWTPIHPDRRHHTMYTVLVVDDERPARELTARMLREAGYDTLQAADGQDALRQLRRSQAKVHAIVADVVMPNMTGTELLARVQ